MYSKLRLFELEHTKLKPKHFFLLNKVRFLEVVKFRFLANFRFLTLQISYQQNIESEVYIICHI